MSSRVGRGPRSPLDRRFEGWDGVIHGGILCSILDEVMAWALVGEDNWGVTARMSVDFRKPVMVGVPIRADGWITRARRRIVDTEGHIVDATTGVQLATATGVYVAADPARKRDLRERYAYRPAEPDGAARQPIRPDRWTPSDDGRTEAPPTTEPPTTTSEATAHAVAFVAAHRDAAEAIGAALAEFTNDPDGFATALTAGLAGPRRPGVPRRPATRRPRHRRASTASAGRCSPPSSAGSATPRRARPPRPLLFIADRLFHERELEARWFAFGLLERTLVTETERTWQLMRRAAREAGDWITVDSLAHPYGKGIAAETYRWAELEQLVYSPSRWERRLIGSTIATMTHVDRKRGRDPESRGPCPAAPRALMGDAEPDVQKALSWAYRSLTVVDRPATDAALREETERAAATDDGHRAWVIRDTLDQARPRNGRRVPRPASQGSASAMAHRPPRPPPRPPPASASSPTPPTIRSPRCDDHPDAARRP